MNHVMYSNLMLYLVLRHNNITESSTAFNVEKKN